MKISLNFAFVSKGKFSHPWPPMMKIWHANSMNPAAARRRNTRRTGTSRECCVSAGTDARLMHQRTTGQEKTEIMRSTILFPAAFPETTTFLNCLQWRKHEKTLLRSLRMHDAETVGISRQRRQMPQEYPRVFVAICCQRRRQGKKRTTCEVHAL